MSLGKRAHKQRRGDAASDGCRLSRRVSDGHRINAHGTILYMHAYACGSISIIQTARGHSTLRHFRFLRGNREAPHTPASDFLCGSRALSAERMEEGPPEFGICVTLPTTSSTLCLNPVSIECDQFKPTKGAIIGRESAACLGCFHGWEPGVSTHFTCHPNYSCSNCITITAGHGQKEGT